MKETNNH